MVASGSTFRRENIRSCMSFLIDFSSDCLTGTKLKLNASEFNLSFVYRRNNVSVGCCGVPQGAVASVLRRGDVTR